MDEKEVWVNLAAEAYRMRCFAKGIAEKSEEPRLARRASNAVTRFDKHFVENLKKLGLELLDFTGQDYETGLPVQPVNLQDFAPDEPLVIETMLEPSIKEYGTANMLKVGVAALQRKHEQR